LRLERPPHTPASGGGGATVAGKEKGKLTVLSAAPLARRMALLPVPVGRRREKERGSRCMGFGMKNKKHGTKKPG